MLLFIGVQILECVLKLDIHFLYNMICEVGPYLASTTSTKGQDERAVLIAQFGKSKIE